MIELHSKSNEEAQPVERVELFSIDGKPYTIEKKVRPNLALRYLHKVNTDGVGLAEVWLGAQLLGDEAYEALLAFEDITTEDQNQIFAAARAIAFGEELDGTGKDSGTSESTARKRTPKQKPSNG